MLALTISLLSPTVCRDSSDLLLQIQDDLSVFIGIDAEQRAELARRFDWVKCEAWQNYLVAAERYHRPNLVVTDLSAHQEMLLDLGGNLFCLLPGVDWSLRRAIAHFGALDRFFADLSRVDDDARRGRCTFPRDVLARFGLSPRHFADASYRFHRGYAALLRFWLDDYLPTLRHEAAELAQMSDLPEPLRLLRDACVRRHVRIERNLRGIALPAVS